MNDKRFEYRPFSQTIYDRLTGEFYEGNSKTEKLLNRLNDENQHIKRTIQEAYQTERTRLGKSVLKQLQKTME